MKRALTLLTVAAALAVGVVSASGHDDGGNAEASSHLKDGTQLAPKMRDLLTMVGRG